MEDLSLHVMDVVENSITSGATVVIVRVEKDAEAGVLAISVQDNGKGMDGEESRLALDPFFTTKEGKRVGLGLPLLRQSAREAGGDMEMVSTPGTGTLIRAEFRMDHPDMKPLGDIEGTIDLLRRFHPEITFLLEWRT
ncbi:MAG: ATP-binding protein [Spirochaetales bacterium]|nr:MAG: ATP-binding protein [Spirochaetales bacterium]